MSKGIILIVEDNQILQDGLRDILDMEGYTVLTAGDGLGAIKLMDQILPDLILSDIAMPVMDGYVFFDAVRSRPDWVTIPFVFLTARGEREDVLNGKKLGVEDYLVKPLSREELITAVRARLARSQQLQVAQLQQAYEASLTVEEALACANCIVAFDGEGLRTVMPDMSGKLNVKDLIEISVQ